MNEDLEYTDEQILALSRHEIHVLAAQAAYLSDVRAEKILKRRADLLRKIENGEKLIVRNIPFTGNPSIELGNPMLNTDQIKTFVDFLKRDADRVVSITNDEEYADDFKMRFIKEQIRYMRGTLDDLEKTFYQKDRVKG